MICGQITETFAVIKISNNNIGANSYKITKTLDELKAVNNLITNN